MNPHLDHLPDYKYYKEVIYPCRNKSTKQILKELQENAKLAIKLSQLQQEEKQENSAQKNVDSNFTINKIEEKQKPKNPPQKLVLLAEKILLKNPKEEEKNIAPINVERSHGEELESFQFGSREFCFYCGDDCFITVDHVIPISYFGDTRNRSHFKNSG